MLAKIKKGIKNYFKGELKVIKSRKDKSAYLLENGIWYKSDLLELKKESGGSRKPKQEVVKVEEKETLDIDLGRVNMELKVGEYETRIKQLIKECESWMIDFNNAKQEKIDFEYKYNEVSIKNESLSKRISLLQEQLISKKIFWKTLFLINISIDIIYLLVRYLWM